MKLTNKIIYDELQKIKIDVATMMQQVSSLRECFKESKIESILVETNDKFTELADVHKTNVVRLNQMTQELKGIVSMSRAALNEGKEFAKISELENINAQAACHVHEFGLYLLQLNKISDKLLGVSDVPKNAELPKRDNLVFER